MSTPALQLQAVHHVAIIASDYARSKCFYVELLGLKVLAENYRAARDSWKLDLALPDGTQLELFSFPQSRARPSRPEACGLRHLCFAVANVAASKQSLEAQGGRALLRPQDIIREDPEVKRRRNAFL